MITDYEKYVCCFRCGISGASPKADGLQFCCDCNSRDLLGVFYPDDFGWIFDGE